MNRRKGSSISVFVFIVWLYFASLDVIQKLMIMGLFVCLTIMVVGQRSVQIWNNSLHEIDMEIFINIIKAK